MTIRAGLARAAFAALALWLALWPAADAITGASSTVLDLSLPAEPPVAGCSAGAEETPECGGAALCSRMLEAKRVSAACGDSRARCETNPATDAEDEPLCAGQKAARCGQCQCIGGLVLFAAAPPQFGPDLELLGTLNSASIDGASRRPRPLLRPPVAAPPLST